MQVLTLCLCYGDDIRTGDLLNHAHLQSVNKALKKKRSPLELNQNTSHLLKQGTMTV